jgi:hypothetical protein
MVIFLNLKPDHIYTKLLIGKGKYSLYCKKNNRPEILKKKCARTKKSAPGHI